MHYCVKVGSFQPIQHLCTDALVQIEAAAATTRDAAWGVDALDVVDPQIGPTVPVRNFHQHRH